MLYIHCDVICIDQTVCVCVCVCVFTGGDHERLPAQERGGDV